jgi:hypothetical protein
MRTLLVTSVLVLGSATAMADTQTSSQTKDATKMASDDCARARKQNKTCVLDMGKEEINGGSPTPGGTSIGFITFGKSESLIRIRKDFIVEILKSAEDID